MFQMRFLKRSLTLLETIPAVRPKETKSLASTVEVRIFWLLLTSSQVSTGLWAIPSGLQDKMSWDYAIVYPCKQGHILSKPYLASAFSTSFVFLIERTVLGTAFLISFVVICKTRH